MRERYEQKDEYTPCNRYQRTWWVLDTNNQWILVMGKSKQIQTIFDRGFSIKNTQIIVWILNHPSINTFANFDYHGQCGRCPYESSHDGFLL